MDFLDIRNSVLLALQQQYIYPMVQLLQPDQTIPLIILLLVTVKVSPR